MKRREFFKRLAGAVGLGVVFGGKTAAINAGGAPAARVSNGWAYRHERVANGRLLREGVPVGYDRRGDIVEYGRIGELRQIATNCGSTGGGRAIKEI